MAQIVIGGDRSWRASERIEKDYANGLTGLDSQTTLTGGSNVSGSCTLPSYAMTTYKYQPNGAPLLENTPTGTYYYITDNQGSIIGLADTNGTPRASYTYTPYGAQTATALNGTLPANPYGYDGGYHRTWGSHPLRRTLFRLQHWEVDTTRPQRQGRL